MKKLRISVRDILIYEEYCPDREATLTYEGEIVSILKTIKHIDSTKEDTILIEVRYPSRYCNSRIKYIKPSQVIGKKRYIQTKEDTITFKVPEKDVILEGIITNVIKCYDDNNELHTVNYAVKCSDSSTYYINETNIIKEESEIIEII